MWVYEMYNILLREVFVSLSVPAMLEFSPVLILI